MRSERHADRRQQSAQQAKDWRQKAVGRRLQSHSDASRWAYQLPSYACPLIVPVADLSTGFVVIKTASTVSWNFRMKCCCPCHPFTEKYSQQPSICIALLASSQTCHPQHVHCSSPQSRQCFLQESTTARGCSCIQHIKACAATQRCCALNRSD